MGWGKESLIVHAHTWPKSLNNFILRNEVLKLVIGHVTPDQHVSSDDDPRLTV